MLIISISLVYFNEFVYFDAQCYFRQLIKGVIMKLIGVLLFCSLASFAEENVNIGILEKTESNKPGKPKTKPEDAVIISDNLEHWLETAIDSELDTIVISLMNPEDEIKSMPVESGFDRRDKVTRHYWNGAEVNIEEFKLNQASEIEEVNWKYQRILGRTKQRLANIPGALLKTVPHGGYLILSAGQVRDLIKQAKGFAIDLYNSPVSTNIDAQLNFTQVATHAFPLGFMGNGIGLYFTETGCPNVSVLNVNNYVQGNTCVNGVATHPTGVASTLQQVAPEATIFGFDQENRPNPSSFTPQLRIGSHSWVSGIDQNYSVEDQLFDNYIYNFRVTLFNAAGNWSSQNPTNFWVHNRGVNEITVGAHCVGLTSSCSQTFANDIAPYSQWKNSTQGAEKPEIIAPTDLNLNSIITLFNGTSAATPFAAAIAADLMEQYPGVRYPEAMKATLIAGSSAPVLFANGTIDKKVGSGGYLRYQSFQTGNLSVRRFESDNAATNIFVNGKKSVIITSIDANKRYRIALAWLNNGDWVMNSVNNNDPINLNMDLDLRVYQNGQLLAQSTSWNSGYEVVDFIAPTSNDITIEITRYWNSGSGNLRMAYAIWENN